MDLTYKQEVGVGALVLIGVAVFLVGMFWLTGRSFSAARSALAKLRVCRPSSRWRMRSRSPRSGSRFFGTPADSAH